MSEPEETMRAEGGAEKRWDMEKLRSLVLDSANVIIAFHDTGNHLVWANRAYLDAAGQTLEELKGRMCYTCRGLKQLCAGCPVVLAIQTGQPHAAILTPQNQPDWPATQGCWRIKASPLKDADGNILGAVEMADDISELCKAQGDLRDANASLLTSNKELNYRDAKQVKSDRILVVHEWRLLALKKEVNTLCARLGEARPYPEVDKF